MIKSSKQFALVRRERTALINLRARTERIVRDFGIIDQAVITTLTDSINKLDDDLDCYFSHFPNEALIDELRNQKKLPELLIKGRLSMGWSKSDLAKKFGLTTQQVYRYEKTMYANISLSKALGLLDLLTEELEGRLTAHQDLEGSRDLT